MLSIFKKELYQYFTTMTGYIFLAALVFVTALTFVSSNVFAQNANYQTTLFSTLSIFLLLIPLLTMRLFAEESRQKTDQLLFTSPVKISHIVLGKFFSATGLFLIGLGITLTFPLIINFYGNVITPLLFASIIGYVLLVCCFISVGIFVSSITDNQLTSAALTFASIFLFFVLNTIISSLPADRSSTLTFLFFVTLIIAVLFYNSTKSKLAGIITFAIIYAIVLITFYFNPTLFDNGIFKILSWFSLLGRFEGFIIGIVDLSDVLYYVSFIVIFNYLTITTLENKRWK